MFSPTIGRGNAVYSPVLPTASSSQANLPPPSMSRQPPPQSVGMASQQSRGSHHSSQSSRHSSYKQHPSLVRPTEQGMQLSEDGVSALDGLAAHQSFASGGGNTSQTSIMGYGTMGMGTSATGRTFQIHRGRPPSRTKPKPTENGAGMEVNRAQTNGVSSKGEVGDEVKFGDVDQYRPLILQVKPRSDSSSVQPPTSPPRTINNAKIEEGATDRVSDSALVSIFFFFLSIPVIGNFQRNYDNHLTLTKSGRFILSSRRAASFYNTMTEVDANGILGAHALPLSSTTIPFVHVSRRTPKHISCIADLQPRLFVAASCTSSSLHVIWPAHL